MLKLIKYDFRRSRELILVFFAIAVLLHIAIWLSNSTMGANLISLHVVTYVFLGLGVIFVCANTYSNNIRFYHRRLLPVHAIYTILSPLLLFLLLLIAMAAVALLHLGIYILIYSADFIPVNFWSVVLNNMPKLIWAAIFSTIMVLFSLTVAGCFRFRGRLWVGLAVFIVLQNILSYLEWLLFGNYFAGLEDAFRFEVETSSAGSGGIVLSNISTSYWPVTFEIVIAAAMFYVMTRLLATAIQD
ncbi:hypothetical protein C2I18_25035 [Paenibacillus sp. PK3_47]|uniref:hypothetical protein n=1 Tax=Paenibacillus sp. PK3_47 TaxID=2072642 RepID=UPI00201DDDFB|nr:hypothetical protein [Paenibacillus sp. PK3_47]UQZ36510.1 hypothetical protein C2I18_25035 [Paenibacillus sp. PK3_47]